MKECILLAGEQRGNEIAAVKKERKEGLVSYLKWLSEFEPRSYAALLSKVLPMQIEHSRTPAATEYKTVRELQQALADRGLPVDRVYPMLQFTKKNEEEAK